MDYFGKAATAKERNKEAEQDEKDKLSSYEDEIDNYKTWERTGESGNTVTISEDEYNMLKNNASYSTTEKVIGTWIDGKPLYQRTFTKNFSSSTGLDIKNLYYGNIDISDVCANIDYGFFVNDMSYYLNTRGFVSGWYEKDSAYLFVITLYSRTNLTGTFTMRYTKTTDTAPSAQTGN